MLNKFLSKRAQSTIEYAVLIGIVVAGLVAMQIYMKRGFQGKLKESADSMGQQFVPGQSTSNYTTISNTATRERTAMGTTATWIDTQKSNRSGNETTPEFGDETLFNQSQQGNGGAVGGKVTDVVGINE